MFIKDTWPKKKFKLNGVSRVWPFLLVDGIYPDYSVLVKGFKAPIGTSQNRFNKWQEKARKDIERLFGVLKKKFAILRKACLKQDRDVVKAIMKVIIALQNFSVACNKLRKKKDPIFKEMSEEELEELGREILKQRGTGSENIVLPDISGDLAEQLSSASNRYDKFVNKMACKKLREDLLVEVLKIKK